MLLAAHLALALTAFVVGSAAVRRRGDAAGHRRLGLAYVALWLLLGASSAILGARRPGVSQFEVVNLVGVAVVLAGFAIPAAAPLRRALGGAWLRWHVRFLAGSLAFPVVAGLHQVAPDALALVGLPYPAWAFWALVASPALILPRLGPRWIATLPAARRAHAARVAPAGARPTTRHAETAPAAAS